MGKEKKKSTKKCKKPYNKKYDQEDIYKAIEAVEAGTSIRMACMRFNVPRSTLYTKMNEIVPIEATRGPSTVLTFKEEEMLVKWILWGSERGFPVTKCFLLERVQKLIEQLDRKNPFKDNKPGRHWYESFCRRHPELAARVAQSLTTRRVSATKEDLVNWFKLVQDHFDAKNMKDLDPSRIFNLDESAFFLCPKGDKVLARKGSRSVYKVVAGNEKESITVLFTIAANGVMLPPFLLFWYERLPANIVNSLPAGWICGSTERGWMTAESFLKYITGQFYPWLVKNKIQFPVALFVDGHSSHLTLELAMFCSEKKIELIALYPNATHILQPLDVAVFRPLKNEWKKAVDQWRLNQTHQLKRENFAQLLKTAIDSMPNLPRIIRNGFATCGLSPFSPDAVDYDILNKSMTKKKKALNNTQAEPQENNIVSAHTVEEENKKHLEQFESRLAPEILSDFKEAVENKTFLISDNSNQGLFDYWLQSKRLCGQNVSNGNENLDYSTHEVDIVRMDSASDAIQQDNNDQLLLAIDTDGDDAPLQQLIVFTEGNDSSFNFSEADIVLHIPPYDNAIESMESITDIKEVYVLQLQDTPTGQKSPSEEKDAVILTNQEVVGQEEFVSEAIAVSVPTRIQSPVPTRIQIPLPTDIQSPVEKLSFAIEEVVMTPTEVTSNTSKSSVELSAMKDDSGIVLQDTSLMHNGNLTHATTTIDDAVNNRQLIPVDEAVDMREQFEQSAYEAVPEVVLDLSTFKDRSLQEITALESPPIKKKDQSADLNKSTLETATSASETPTTSQEFKQADVTKDDHAIQEKSVEAVFQEILPYAQNIIRKKPTNKHISPVLTSEQWRSHQKKIKEEKENKQREIQERKRFREEKKRQKEEEKKERKAKLEEKKKLDEEIKKLQMMKKNIVQIKKEKED